MLVSSMHDETLFAERVLRAGATGYISKQEPPEMLLRAIRQVLRGEMYLSPRMTSRLCCGAWGHTAQEDPVQSLSNREIEVFEMIGQGLTIQAIRGLAAAAPRRCVLLSPVCRPEPSDTDDGAAAVVARLAP